MKNYRYGEGVSSPERLPTDIQAALSAHCDPYNHETPLLSLDDIASRLVSSPNLIMPVRKYLSHGGPGYVRDMDAANSIREKLAWFISDKALARLR